MAMGCFQGLLKLYFFSPHKSVACLTVLCAAKKMSVKSHKAKTTVKSTQYHFWKYLQLSTLQAWHWKDQLNKITFTNLICVGDTYTLHENVK